MGALLPGRADRLASSPLALAVLVGANAVPLLAVLLWGWTVYEVVLFYWVENGVVGALNLPKILVASGGSGESDGPGRLPSFEDVSAGNVVAAAFFVFHYGVFWVVHGVFVFVLAGFLGASGPFEVPWVPVALAAGTMLVSHGVSFWRNYLAGGEYREVSAGEQMHRPYGRVVALHVTIVLGAFAVAALGSPLAVLLLLVGLKTVFDVMSHLRDHASAPTKPTA